MGCGLSQANDASLKQGNTIKSTANSDSNIIKEKPNDLLKIEKDVEKLSVGVEIEEQKNAIIINQQLDCKRRNKIYRITEMSNEDSFDIHDVRNPKEVLLELGYELHEESGEEENENTVKKIDIPCKSSKLY